MFNPETGEVTCPNCNATFPADEMTPRDATDDANTMVHWLVAGTCPRCQGEIEVSLDSVRKAAIKAAKG